MSVTTVHDHRRFAVRLAGAAVALLAVWLAGCAAAPPNGTAPASGGITADEFRQQVTGGARVDQINQDLMALAVGGGAPSLDYRIGPDDSMKVTVFGVPELSQEYRVSGSGDIVMPLVGSITVAGLTVSDAERVIEAEYGRSYLRNPQVSVQVTEFRSQRYMIIGSVGKPQIYSTNRPVSLVEALTLAGGVAEGAGDFVYVTDRVYDPETGEMQTRSLVLAVEDLLLDPIQNNFVLGESAVVNVPRGGFVYVEGDVGRPGVYAQSRTTSILTVLAQAGGLKWEAEKSSLRLMRRDPDTREWTMIEKNYYDIRDNPQNDMSLLNGDVLVVSSQPLKAAWLATARAIGAMIFVGAWPY
jgi:polysaccharide biosynthesis/export protein